MAGAESAVGGAPVALSPSIERIRRRRKAAVQETKISQSRRRATRARKFVISCFLSGRYLITPLDRMKGVYARRKGPVKRKGVISRGCEANGTLPVGIKLASNAI